MCLWHFCSRLCFLYDKETDDFVATVLDPGILDLKLVDQGKRLMGSKWKHPELSLHSLTYRDLDGRKLQFAPGNLHRPYKRALNFQARQARKYALRQRWKPVSWDFEDFFTEGLDVSQKLEKWFSSLWMFLLCSNFYFIQAVIYIWRPF